MKKKEIFLVVFTIVLAGLYIYYFTDLFAPKIMRIQHSVRPFRDAWSPGGRATNSNSRLTYVISFVLNREWRLDDVKMVVATEFATNKYAHPVWHLVADKTSSPIKAFIYGGPIPGMHPAVPGAEPDPLDPNKTYKLVVRSGKVQGEDEIQLTPTQAR